MRSVLMILLTSSILFCGCTNSGVRTGGEDGADLIDSHETSVDFRTSNWEELWLDGCEALNQSRLVDARRLLEEALDEARAMPRGNMRLGVTLDRLADAYMQTQMTREAQKHYQEAVDTFDACLKASKSESNTKLILKEQAGTLVSLATILLDQRKLKQAEELLDKANAACQRVAGSTMETKDRLLTMDYALCLKELAYIYEHTGRKGLSEEVSIKSNRFELQPLLADYGSTVLHEIVQNEKNRSIGIDVIEERRIEDMIKTWTPLQGAGEEAAERMDLPNAKMLFRQAYYVARKISPANDQAMDSLTSLLKVINKTQNYAEAEKLIDESLPKIRTSEPTKRIDNVYGEMARTYARQKKWRQTEDVFKERLKLREAIRGPQNFHVAETLEDLGAVYIQTGDRKQAEYVLRKALKILTENHMTNDKLAIKIKGLLAFIEDPDANKTKSDYAGSP